MRVVLFGATGMVGHGVLTALLEDPTITGVVSVSRRVTGRSHPKLKEVLHRDFLDYRELDAEFAAAHATLFCLGTPSVGKTEPEYTRITRDYAVAAAAAALRNNPDSVFGYVSANRADSTSRTMWIRVKGRAEENLAALHPRAFFLRPGFIRPCRGARPATRAQRVVYAVLTPFHPLLKLLFPTGVTTTDAIAHTMLELIHAPESLPRRLDNTLINQIAERGAARVTADRPPRSRS
ncbi:epimerase [Actinoplanes sichuanensis]|uniref:NAD-dependent epimerase/dehydratase family protein n=1 Tax=Actinoplanes sichuanensis TaxID=512349 RepID=A0ABW4ATD0_9ACTN|nr:NAD-dependent epimerase/dehydratase family protein [Actinoplanes sichuanensis]BEL05241.1 epimerase [Actinoplanes sichuanensis]